MRFVYENPELEKAIADATTLDALNDALARVANLVPTFMTPQVRGQQMFAPGLDATAPKIARKLNLADVTIEKSNENVCIVATRFYSTGGHSKVGADITRLIGKPATSLVFTDIYRQLRHSQLISTQSDTPYQYRSAMLLSAPTLAEKIIELYMLLAAMRPSRIFLIGNHMDMVATAGVWPFRSVVEYVHHADHLPTLGATLPFAVHADLTYTCHLACQEAGLDPVYAGMTVELEIETPRLSPTGDGRARIATCGALHKYRQAAEHRWMDFVIAAMRGRDAEFVHIGPWDESFAAEVRLALEAAGVDPQAYRFTGPVPNLRAALIAEGATHYLASYPDSGGRANLEALAAGLAPIVPVAIDLAPLMHFDLPLEYWVRLTDPAEIPAALERSVDLSRQLRAPAGEAALAREFNRFDAYVLGRETKEDAPSPG